MREAASGCLRPWAPWELPGQIGVTAAHPATILQALKGSVVDPTNQQGGAEGPSRKTSATSPQERTSRPANPGTPPLARHSGLSQCEVHAGLSVWASEGDRQEAVSTGTMGATHSLHSMRLHRKSLPVHPGRSSCGWRAESKAPSRAFTSKPT